MPNSAIAALHAFAPRPLTADEVAGYLAWSLDFFTDSDVLQDPFVDICLQLDVTDAYANYRATPVEGLSFFSFLVWHLAQCLQGHLGFKLRKVGAEWVVLENAPIVIPVAVGGAMRFSELLLENLSQQSLAETAAQYRRQLEAARSDARPRMQPDTYLTACFIGNLPNLQFTALNLHWRKATIQGQPSFYFGKRYQQGERLFIPFAAKLHHACTDPFVLNALIADFLARFALPR